MIRLGGGIVSVTLTISTTQTSLYDMRAAYIAAGHPAGAPAEVTLIINAACQAGIDQGTGSGGWPAGSTCTIINNSGCYGTGGKGGNGGVAQPGNLSAGAVGLDGGDALILRIPTTIDNAAGYIFGGGGGGGGGGGAALEYPASTAGCGGGGGGGGRGYNNANGGTGGSGVASSGTAGTAGSGTAKGTGGPGGSTIVGPTQGGSGGNGGDWGSNGVTGSTAPAGVYKQPGGSRGLAGRAIVTNGNAYSIIAGNNATQIKGSIV